MEDNTIKGWRKKMRSVRRLYHSLNNYRMKSKDADFKEFSLLEYATVLPEEVKEPKRLQYIKQLELAKKGYINKDLKVFLASSKQKELAGDFKKSIKANQKVLDLEFDKTEKLELVKKRLVEINTDLDEKYDAEPEEVETDKSQTKPLQKSAKTQGVSFLVFGRWPGFPRYWPCAPQGFVIRGRAPLSLPTKTNPNGTLRPIPLLSLTLAPYRALFLWIGRKRKRVGFHPFSLGFSGAWAYLENSQLIV